MRGEDVLDQHRHWCSLCRTTAHDECEARDNDFRYQCMVCNKMIPEDREICLEGWAWVHTACAEAWAAQSIRPKTHPILSSTDGTDAATTAA